MAPATGMRRIRRGSSSDNLGSSTMAGSNTHAHLTRCRRSVMAPGDDGSSACSGGTFSKMGVPIAATPPASSNVAAAGAGVVPSLSDKLWLEQQEKQRQNQNQNQQHQQQVASVISSGSISKKKKLFIPAAPSSSGSTGSMMGRQQQQLNSNTNAVPTSQQSNNGNLGPGLLGASIRMNTTGSTSSSVTFGQQVKRASPFKHSKRTMAMVYHAFGNCTKTKGGEEEDDDTFDPSNSAMEMGNYENGGDFERNSLLYSTKSHGNYSFRMQQQQQQQQLNKRRRISRMIFGGVLLSFGLLYMGVFRPRLNRRGQNSSPFGTSPDDELSSATAGFLSSLRHSSILSSSFSGTENNDSTRQSQSTSKLSKNVNVLKQGAIIPFPLQFSSLSNLTTTYNPTRETPYFWDVHFSGESIAEAIFGHCHGLVQACEFGMRQPDYNEDKLELFDLDGVKYVNVDTTTIEGIIRANKLGLSQSRLANIIISPHIHEMSARIFTPEHPGRMFALFRHPVDRALGLYYYLAKASWDPMYNPSLTEMSMEDYAKSEYIENNWMTRFLVQKPRGKLSQSDMILAKQIIKFKCLVGLYDDIETSMVRFQRYFGWNLHDTTEKMDEVSNCRKKFVEDGDKNVLGHPISIKEETGDAMEDGVVKVGSAAWNSITRQNMYDMELYEFAKKIYKIQGEQIFSVP